MVLSSKWFQLLAVPLGFTIIGVVAKRLGRHEHDTSPTANDLAVGTTVLLMTLGTIAADVRACTTSDQTNTLLGWLIGALCLVFISIDHDRYRSWQRDEYGKPNGHKRFVWGVVLPDVLAIGLFATYRYGTWS